jgi:lysophospholipid acyltransferase (LPLAT)-like uncharacterized protein
MRSNTETHRPSPGLTDRLLLGLVPPLGALIIRALGATLRWTEVNRAAVEPFWGAGRPVIVAFWHGHQLMLPLHYRGPSRPAVLVSRHRDGELIARVLARFGFETVRGSTTRGAAAGLAGMVRAAAAGCDLAVTPDGPRGPRHVAQLGAIALAKHTGLPLLPVAFGALKKKACIPGMDSSSRIRSAAPC